MTAKAVEVEVEVEEEYHVASFVAQITPGHEPQIKALLNDTPGAEIHAISETGKVVFTIEAAGQWIIGKHIDAIKSNAGFLTLAPVYHEYTTE
jgi:nitrate reductase NapD